MGREVSSLKELTGSEYLSFSTMTQYLECGERFRLERVERVPRGQAWWFFGGNAFHKATELLDRGVIKSADDAWHEAWLEQMANVVDLNRVQAGGRKTREFPRGEDGVWWMTHGPLLVERYVRWRSERRLAGWSLATVNSEPGIEIPFRVEFDGVPVQGVIDRLWMNGDGEHIVVDYKAGSKAPSNLTQLGIYGVALAKQHGIDVKSGAYYLARAGEMAGPYALRGIPLPGTAPKDKQRTSPLDAAELEARFARALAGIEAENFEPHITSKCATCPVRWHCSAWQDKESKER